MSYNTDPMGAALDRYITGNWGEDQFKFDNEMLFEDGDNNGETWIEVELKSNGLDVTCGDDNGNTWGTTFSIEELENILAKLKGLQ